jgi:hypothetical protein
MKARAHVVRDRGRENAVQAQPDESFNKLMNGKENGQRGEEQFAAVLDFSEG